MAKNVDAYQVEDLGYNLNIMKNLLRVTQDNFDVLENDIFNYKQDEYSATLVVNDLVEEYPKIKTLLRLLLDQCIDNESKAYKLALNGIKGDSDEKGGK